MVPAAVLALALLPCPAGGFGREHPLPPVTVPAETPYGYTYAPAHDVELTVRFPARPYNPQPGDVIFMSDTNALWTSLYAIALTGAPGHIGLVVRLPDGQLGLHEAGFNESRTTRTTPLDYRLNQYPGKVWVRRVKAPLTADQDARLTEFAEITENSRYDLRTAARQLTFYRHRGPVRTVFLARPKGPHQPLICSEAVLEGLVFAGLIDPMTARPEATFPRDLFFDRSINPYINRHPPLAAGWEQPALWTPVVGLAAKGRDRPPVDGVVIPPPAPVPSHRRSRR